MAQKTYAQIKKQIDALEREAEALRSQEVNGVVARIREAIAHYGLTAEQLGYGVASRAAKGKAKKVTGSSAPAYSDGLGNSWGGRGPRPQWLKAALVEGKTLEDFAASSNSSAAKPEKRTKKKLTSAAPKRAVGKTYRNEAGGIWSGRGPRPRWLKEALAAGQTLEQLVVPEA